jgi:hypothetical protein
MLVVVLVMKVHTTSHLAEEQAVLVVQDKDTVNPKPMVPLDLRGHNILEANRQTLVMAVQAVTAAPLEMQELLVLQAVTAAPIVGATVHQVQVVVPQVEL